MSRFPDNKRFAFTVCDDTDFSTVENVLPVYRLLADLGFRTTKLVWSLGSVTRAPIGGDSLQNTDYLDFVRWLDSEGFEIGLHNARSHNSTREVTKNGFEEFWALLGKYPRVHCNHSNNAENIYWGGHRFSLPSVKFAHNLATGFSRGTGHVSDSVYFWGDICKERVSYVRNFVFNEINLDRINPTMPYHDPLRPYVNYWFSSSEGANVESFCKMLCESNQDRLAAEGGVCIMYTHFACGFWKNGVLNPEFVRLMTRLARMDGWLVPVSTLLDHLRNHRNGNHVIPQAELAHMERRWFLWKLGRSLI
jgi:hypothetical protein